MKEDQDGERHANQNTCSKNDTHRPAAAAVLLVMISLDLLDSIQPRV